MNRKRIIAKLSVLSVVVGLFASLAVGLLLPAEVLAATASASLTANKSAAVQGNNFTVALRVNVDAGISIANVRVSYDPSLVQYISTSYSGASLTTDTPEAGTGSNYVQVSRYQLTQPFPSGDMLVGTLTFRARSNTGTAAINVDQSNSSVYVAGSQPEKISISSVTPANVVLQPVPSAPPSSNPSTPTPTPTAGGTTSSPSSSSGGTSGATTTGGGATTQTDPDYQQAQEAAAAAEAENPTSSTIPAPGKGQYGSSVTVWQRVKINIKKFTPLSVVLALTGGATWFAVKRLRQRPFGFSAAAITGAAGGGTPSVPGSEPSGMVVGGPSGKSVKK